MRLSKEFSVGPAAVGAALLLALASVATAQDAPSPRDKLAVWTGHWKRHGEVKETQFGRARTFDYDAQCSFLPHGAFVACGNVSLAPDPNHGNRISNCADLFYYSDADKTFKYSVVCTDGGTRGGVVLVDGNVWTEPVEIPAPGGGTADGHFRYTFVSPDKVLGRFEVSLDKGTTWILVDEFVDSRVD